MAKQIDTVTVEVVRNLLMSIAEETYGIIVRSAYSTNMKERRDVCTAVIDPDGNIIDSCCVQNPLCRLCSRHS